MLLHHSSDLTSLPSVCILCQQDKLTQWMKINSHSQRDWHSKNLSRYALGQANYNVNKGKCLSGVLNKN